MSLGQATSFAPSYKKGVTAAGHIKALLDVEPTIDAYSQAGDKPVSEITYALPIVVDYSVNTNTSSNPYLPPPLLH